MQLLYGPLAGRPRVSDVVRAELPRPKAGVEPWAHLPGFTPQQPVPVSERAFASAQAAEPLDAATYASYRDSARPLVIDNGASELRAGFAMGAGASDLTALAAAQPHVAFDNVVSRFRDRKSNTTFIVAGAEAYSDAQSRGSVRSAFDGDVLTAPDILVSATGYFRSWEGSLGGCSPPSCSLARLECPVLMLLAAAGERAGLHLPAVRRQCGAGGRGLGAAPRHHDRSAVQPVNIAYR